MLIQKNSKGGRRAVGKLSVLASATKHFGQGNLMSKAGAPAVTDFITVASDGSVTTLFNNTATTDLNIKDHEDTYRTVPAGVVPFEGARFVENLFTYSEDFSNAAWGASNVTKTTGQIDPDGGSTACTLTATSANGYIYQHTSGHTAGGKGIFSIWMRRRTGTGEVRMRDHVSSYTTITLTDVWQRFTVAANSNAETEQLIVAYITTSGDEVDVAFALAEDATGRTDTTTPSEYVKSEATAGFKTFFTANGNSVASNVVTEAVGADLSPVPSIFYTPAATNTWTYSRDLTNGSYTKRGTITITYDEVGVSGEANTASKLTGLSTNSVADVYRSLSGFTVSASVGVLVFLKTVTTSGTLIIQNPQGSTYGKWEVDLSSVSTTKFDALSETHPAVTVTTSFASTGGGICGVHFLMSSGTADIIVGNIHQHDNKTDAEVRALPPIFTTTAPASIDRFPPKTPDLSWFDNDKFVVYCKATIMASTSEMSGNQSFLDLANADGLLYYDGTNGDLESTDGTNTLTKAHTITSGTQFEFVIGADASTGKMYMAIDGSAYTEGTYDGAYPTTSNLLELFYNLGYVAKIETLEITLRGLSAGQSWGTARMAA